MRPIQRWTWTSLAALMAVTLVVAAPVAAQAPAAVQAPGGTDKRVTLDLREIPLRDAVSLLFQGSGLQYTIDPNVLSVPITLNIRDIALPAALRLIVRQAAVSMPGLTSAKEGDIYMIRIRQAAPAAPPVAEEAPPDQQASDEDLTWEKIPIQFNNVAVFALAFGGTMLPTEQDVLLMRSGGGRGGMGGGYGGMGGGMGGMMGGGMGGMMGGGMMGGMGGGMMGGGMMGGMGGGMMGGMGGGMMGGGMMGGGMMGGGMMGGGMMGGGMGGFGGGGLGGGRRF